MAILSGSNLSSWALTAQYITDPAFIDGERGGKIIEILSGGGYTPGKYTTNGDAAPQPFAGPGTYFILGQDPGGAGTAGGVWQMYKGDSGAGFSGTNLIRWLADPSWVYDPDAPLSPSLNGTTLVIAPGPGVAFPGTYAVESFVVGFGTGQQGAQNMAKLTAIGGNYPLALLSDGGVWEKGGGDTILIPEVNEDYTGDIEVVAIGDSIMFDFTAALTAQYPNANSITVINKGAPGTRTIDWASDSGGLLSEAVAAAEGMTNPIILGMLGTNDSKDEFAYSAATHKGYIQTITNAFSLVGSLRGVLWNEQPYIIPGSGGGSWSAASNTLIQSYYNTYATVSGATQGITGVNANYQFFERNPQLSADGVHTNDAGRAELVYTFLTGLAPLITGDAPPAPSGNARFSKGLRLGLGLGLDFGTGFLSTGTSPTPPPALTVTGAGTSYANGEYADSGSMSGGQILYAATTCSISFNSGAGVWQLYVTADMTVLYENGGGAHPWSTTWNTAPDGSDPAPIVIEG